MVFLRKRMFVLEEAVDNSVGVFNWWKDIDESEEWQRGIYFTLCAAYGFVSLVALIHIKNVEDIIDYKFKNKKLLEEALTHPSKGSTTGSPSYQRLEFFGDSVISLAISKRFFSVKPPLNPGELTSLRSANVSNHKLTRLAARLGLYNHVQGTNSRDYVKQADKFEKEMREDDWLVYGRAKGPKFLADIVESIAAAIYVDLDFDMQKLCPILERRLLKPIVTLEDLENHPQPIKELYELCQKQGKQIEIKCEIDRYENHFNASVYINEKFFASESSKIKKNARIKAAMEALSKLPPKTERPANDHELRDQKKKWTKTIYKLILLAILFAFIGNVMKD